MIIAGKFKIVSTNLVTGEVKEVEKGNIITNKFYSDILKDDSDASIGFYLWTSPFEMTKTRRRIRVESSEMFLNDAYGYMPLSDWFARYVPMEDNQPGYFETRTRIDPPDTGIRVIRSVIMSSTQSRVDGVTGLLPDHGNNTIKDIRMTDHNNYLSKLDIFAFATLDDDCIQSDIEVFDIYYRLIFDNNYGMSNISKTTMELLGKQSTAKMPTINVQGTFLSSTPVEPPQLSQNGPVNFILNSIVPNGISPTNGDSWHDYANILPSTKIDNGYVRTYSVDMGKDFHIGKIVSSLSLVGHNSSGYISGQRSIHNNGDRTIGNTHSHNNIYTKPFFDPLALASGTGYCDMTSTEIPSFPEFITLDIIESGSLNSAQYKIRKYPYTGFYKNTFETLPIDAPHISQIVINQGSWRSGLYYNGTDRMHGFLTGRAGTIPSLAGLTYDTLSNADATLGRMSVSTYSGIKEFSEVELLGYDNEGLSILSLNGSVRSIDRHTYSLFDARNITQVEIDKVTGYTYVACTTTGLYRVNSTLTQSIKIVPTGSIPNEPCYGFNLYKNEMIAWMDSAIYVSADSGLTWSSYPHPDYTVNGFDKTKIIGIRADLTIITENVLVLFSNIDNDSTTPKTDILSAWWSPTIFNPLVITTPNIVGYGTSPSFMGIDYVEFINGTFYLTFFGEYTYGGDGISINSILFNTSVLTEALVFPGNGLHSIPTFFKYDNKDYVFGMSAESIMIKNITDNVMVEEIGSYGHSSPFTNMAAMSISPFYSAFMSTGLIFIRGTTQFSVNIHNSSSVNNIRNDNLRENALGTVSKIINPFFNSSSRGMFEKVYGWDGFQFTTGVTAPKLISSGPNVFQNINLEFTGLELATDFVAGDSFTAIRAKGIAKDNASLAKIFFSNSNYVKTETFAQSGVITPVSSYFKLDQFEKEEATVSYTTDHFTLPKRTTPFDFLTTRRIPQEAGTIKIPIENGLDGGYAVVLETGLPEVNTRCSIGVAIYSTYSGIKVRVVSESPSYKKSEMLTGDTNYSEISVVNGDDVELSWTTGTKTRVFSLKVAGTTIISGINFGSSYYSTNDSELILYYSVLSIEHSIDGDEITIPKPEIRHDSNSNLIAIPLGAFNVDPNSLSINGDNYGPGGDIEIYVDGVLSENTGVYGEGRELIVSKCKIDNLSGTVYFSRNDEAKDYSITYNYYKDSQ